LGLVEPHTTGLGPLIQSVQIPLQSLPTLKQMDTPAQLGVVCKLTEGTLSPLIQVIDEALNKTRPKTEPWGTPLVTRHQLDLTPFTTPLCAQP